MSQAPGILTVQIWRTSHGELQARVGSKLDVTERSPLAPVYCTSLEEITLQVAEWFQRYAGWEPPAGKGS
jgi:hypothetical protein